jgi:hypothetical protein
VRPAIQARDLEKLADRPPARWSKQQFVVNSLFLVIVAY